MSRSYITSRSRISAGGGTDQTRAPMADECSTTLARPWCTRHKTGSTTVSPSDMVMDCSDQVTFWHHRRVFHTAGQPRGPSRRICPRKLESKSLTARLRDPPKASECAHKSYKSASRAAPRDPYGHDDFRRHTPAPLLIRSANISCTGETQVSKAASRADRWWRRSGAGSNYRLSVTRPGWTRAT